MIDIFAIHHRQLARRTASNPVEYASAVERPARKSDAVVWVALVLGGVAAIVAGVLS